MRPPFVSSRFGDFVFRIGHNIPTCELRGDCGLHDPLGTVTEERLGWFCLDNTCLKGEAGDAAVTGVQHPHTPSFKLAPHT